MADKQLRIIDNETGEILSDNDAWTRHRRIVEMRNGIERTFIDLGGELYYFEKEKQYQEMGHPTFESYLADPDVDISRRVAFRLKGIYETFILNEKVPPVALFEAGNAKLDMVRPHVGKGEYETDELIAMATSLSRSDLRKALNTPDENETPEFPEGTFEVIYADPPWSYDNSGFNQSAASQYPTMTISDICELDVKSLCTDDSVLFMWATSPLLPEAFEVIEAWGFEYKASMIWVKDRAPGMGWWVNTKHELLLMASKPSADKVNHPSKKFDSVIEAPVTRHSAKPHIFYELIEEMYDGEKIELFARNNREGWDNWGNENV